MDYLTIPIPLVVFESNGKSILSEGTDSKSVFQNVTSGSQDIAKRFGVELEVENTTNAKGLPLCVARISGQRSSVAPAHQLLNTRYQKMHSTTIRANVFHLFDHNLQMKPDIKGRLADIMTKTQTEIMVRLENPLAVSPSLFAIDTAGEIAIEVRGAYNPMCRARIECMILLDSLMGLFCDHVDVELRRLPLICGRKRQSIKQIMEDTSASIYIPSLWQYGSNGTETRIHISAETQQQLSAAKDALVTLSKAKAAVKLQSTPVKMNFQKLLMLQGSSRKALCDLMIDYATAVEFTDSAMLMVYGEREGQIEATIKRLTDLCGELVMAHLGFPNDISSRFERKRLMRMSAETQCAIRFSGNAIDVVGDMAGVMRFFESINNPTNVLSQLVNDITIYVEMSSEYKDFITGKKNGKINKIIKTANVRLDLTEELAHSLHIVVNSPQVPRILEALSQLKDELPAEYEFYIPDYHHKRIIGVGGKNIQTVMKNYGVYVKFIGSEEFKPLGGLVESDNNVLARTPAKNGGSLAQLYHAVMDQVNPDDRDYVTMSTDVARRYHHILFGQKAQKKMDLEKQYRVTITIPWSEYGSEKVAVRGSANDVQSAFKAIKDWIPETYYYRTPKSDELNSFANGSEFAAVVAEVKKSFSLQLRIGVIAEQDQMFEILGTQATARNINPAVERLISVLREKGLKLYPSNFDDAPELAADRPDVDETDVVFFQGFSSFNYPSSAKAKHVTGSAPDLQALIEEVSKAPSNAQLTVAEPMRTNVATPPRNTRREPENALLRQVMTKPAYGASRSFGSLPSPTPHRSSHSSESSPLRSAPHSEKSSTSSLFGSQTSADTRSVGSIKRPPSLRIRTSTESPGDPETQALLKSVLDNVLPMNGKDENKLGILLDSLDLAKYKITFLNNDVDFETFLSLTEEDMKELGVSLGARRRLTTAIAEIKARRAMESQSARFPASPLAAGLGGGIPTGQDVWGSSGNWSKFSLYSAPVDRPAHLRTLTGNFVPSPISPSKNIGFVDFVPDGTPLGSPLNSTFSLHISPTKSSRDITSNPSSHSVMHGPFSPSRQVTAQGSLTGSLMSVESSRDDLKAPGSQRKSNKTLPGTGPHN